MSTKTPIMNSPMNTPETRFSLIGRLNDAENAEAWNEFVQLYQPLIFRIAQRRGLQHADAAEVTQEVLGRVAGAIGGWDPNRSKGSFRGWLYRITRNLTIDYLRKASRQPLNLAELSGLPIHEMAGADDRSSREFQTEYEKQLFVWAAHRVQSEFRPNTWKSFWRTAVDGADVDKVASELGLSKGAIYVARSRVMKRLSEEVRKRSEESIG